MSNLPTNLALNQVVGLIESYAPHLQCWKAGLYYGSMIYFELGDRMHVEIRGMATVVGSANLVVSGYNWTIVDNGNEVARSNTITRDIAEGELCDRFAGKHLTAWSIDEQTPALLIMFDSDLMIRVWVDSDAVEFIDDELAALFLPNGDIITCNVKTPGEKRLELRTSRSERTARYWRQSHLS